MSDGGGARAVGEPALIELVTFDEALRVGRALHDYWPVIAGARETPPFYRDDLLWGDLVQFVIRRANLQVRDRQGGKEE